MRVIEAKDYKLLVLPCGKALINTPLQTFILQGVDNNTRQIAYIITEAEKGNVDSLINLASLFYTEKNEQQRKQVVELIPTRLNYHV